MARGEFCVFPRQLDFIYLELGTEKLVEILRFNDNLLQESEFIAFSGRAHLLAWRNAIRIHNRSCTYRVTYCGWEKSPIVVTTSMLLLGGPPVVRAFGASGTETRTTGQCGNHRSLSRLPEGFAALKLVLSYGPASRIGGVGEHGAKVEFIVLCLMDGLAIALTEPGIWSHF